MTEKNETLSTSAGKRRDTKILKKAKSSWDSVIASVADMCETEKIKKIESEYIKLFGDLCDTNKEMKIKDRTIAQLQKDYAQSQMELKKTLVARTKLENLARELQKHNKEIKDENYNRLKEEEEKRKEVAASFSEKLNAIASLMDENKDKSVRLQEENLSMTTKLSELYNQFQERETNLANMNSQMELQKKLSETQMKKLEIEFEAERQLWTKERAYLMDNLQKSEDSNKVLQDNVKTLQEHLNTYQRQYSDFKTTMERSNEVFDNFKGEIAKMHKSNATLEKDRNEWHNKWQSGTQTILHLTDLHQQAAIEQNRLKKKVAMLEKLCRQLNAERTAYLQSLKDHNIEPVVPVENIEEPSAPVALPQQIDPPTVIKTSKHHKPTEKEKKLVGLKNELKRLQAVHEESIRKELAEEKLLAKQQQSNVENGVSNGSKKPDESEELTADMSPDRTTPAVTSEPVQSPSAVDVASGIADMQLTSTQEVECEKEEAVL